MALRPLMRWMCVGAGAPGGTWLAVILVGFFTRPVDEVMQVLGYLPILIVFPAVPGALVGLVLGLLDGTLVRRVVDRLGSRSSVGFATAMMSIPVVGAVILLQLYLSYWVPVLASVAMGVLLVLAPIAVCARRYQLIVRGVFGPVYRE